jgi:hypothetical protein
MEQPQVPTDAPATDQPDVPLVQAITDTLLRLRPSALAEGEQIDQACRDQAEAVVQLLEAEGHVLPGAPPAAQIFADAKRFHDQLTLTALALRVLNMLAFNNVQTPETKPARKWIDDYLQGVNHGPAGQPMLWPGRLPGMAAMLRDWGFVPTIALPGQPSFVARAMPNPTVQ